MLPGNFINGLKHENKVEVHLINQVSWEHAMEMAVKVEEKHMIVSL